MKFARSRRRPVAESVVPMINVVFLLLIFFMMSARIAPAPPFALTLPQSGAEAKPEGDLTLYLSAEGVAGYRGALGDAAWAGLAQGDRTQTLVIRADADLSAPALAKVLTRLAGMGILSVEIAVRTS